MLLRLALSAIAATTVVAINNPADDYVPIVTFDGTKSTHYQWKTLNDPVMGGLSTSTFTPETANATAVWDGTVRIVPKLQAPGFCVVQTKYFIGVKFTSAAGYDGLEIKMKTNTDYHGWKLSFAGHTLNPQFASYKADFNVTADGGWHSYQIPFNAFSNNWNAATGEPNVRCTENTQQVCPTQKALGDLQQIGIWAEGAAGDFNAEFEYIRAIKFATTVAPRRSSWDNTCKGKVQSGLRFNFSDVSTDNLIIPVEDDETFVDAICCDKNFQGLAEPRFFFSSPEINLFAALNATGPNTFYDPVCGLPLFQIPSGGRTFEQFQADTNEHGWPSFRPQEVIEDNVELAANGFVYSKCGTYLGSNEPDAEGVRYCLDTACVSGNPV